MIHEVHILNADIKFKTTMLKSDLSDYTDAYIFVKGTITITGRGDDDAARQLDERDKGVSDNYSKISGSLWQYYRDDPNNNIEQSESFKSKIKITWKTAADGKTKDVEILVLLKYLSNFWRTLEMPLMNCDVELILT